MRQLNVERMRRHVLRRMLGIGPPPARRMTRRITRTDLEDAGSIAPWVDRYRRAVSPQPPTVIDAHLDDHGDDAILTLELRRPR